MEQAQQMGVFSMAIMDRQHFINSRCLVNSERPIEQYDKMLIAAAA